MYEMKLLFKSKNINIFGHGIVVTLPRLTNY
jgi:hypothetical protein